MAENNLLTVTNEELVLLRQMLADYLRDRRFQPRFVDEPDDQATEVHVARTPTGGIPARTLLDDGSTEPGRAECDIYRITVDRDGNPLITEVYGLAKTVYNVSATSIAQDSWVAVHKDKWGIWLVSTPGTSGFWARLTNKTYVDGNYVAYSWVRVIPNVDSTPLDFTDTDDTGEPGNYPAYEVNNSDLPVAYDESEHGTASATSTSTDTTASNAYPFIAWLVPGDGAFYLFEQAPRWEDLEIDTSLAAVVRGSVTYRWAWLLRYNQVTKLVERTYYVLVRDISS